ncbi:winged helix-turn-helix transcriptional regulator [Longivirga aurantiaca]|uniref:Winged helix-turn-helix transcriptional regulator n=1 Tax=Longivirga aurantiaca TaxID=1837743 RepID=A0ABW1SXW8_9ACTN
MATTTRTDAPEALAWRTDNCTVIRAVEIFGDRWSFVLLREVFLGVRRFADIQDHTGIPRQVLSTRLDRLVDQGLLRRVPYQEPGQRVRDEYRLTEAGFDLYPVLVAMADWGNRYVADKAGPPIELVHQGCDHEVHVALRCDAGHDLEGPRDVVVRRGPGARRRTG